MTDTQITLVPGKTWMTEALVDDLSQPVVTVTTEIHENLWSVLPLAQIIDTDASSGIWTFNRGAVALGIGTILVLTGVDILELDSIDVGGTVEENETGRMGVYIDLLALGFDIEKSYILRRAIGAMAGLVGIAAFRRRLFQADAGGVASTADQELSFMPPDATNIVEVLDDGFNFITNPAINLPNEITIKGRYISLVVEGGEPFPEPRHIEVGPISLEIDEEVQPQHNVPVLITNHLLTVLDSTYLALNEYEFVYDGNTFTQPDWEGWPEELVPLKVNDSALLTITSEDITVAMMTAVVTEESSSPVHFQYRRPVSFTFSGISPGNDIVLIEGSKTGAFLGEEVTVATITSNITIIVPDITAGYIVFPYYRARVSTYVSGLINVTGQIVRAPDSEYVAVEYDSDLGVGPYEIGTNINEVSDLLVVLNNIFLEHTVDFLWFPGTDGASDSISFISAQTNGDNIQIHSWDTTQSTNADPIWLSRAHDAATYDLGSLSVEPGPTTPKENSMFVFGDDGTGWKRLAPPQARYYIGGYSVGDVWDASPWDSSPWDGEEKLKDTFDLAENTFVGFVAAGDDWWNVFDTQSGIEAVLALDYENNQYMADGLESSFAVLHTFIRGSQATQRDNVGLLKFAPHNLVLQSNDFDTTWAANLASLTQTITGPDNISNSAWTFTTADTTILVDFGILQVTAFDTVGSIELDAVATMTLTSFNMEISGTVELDTVALLVLTSFDVAVFNSSEEVDIDTGSLLLAPSLFVEVRPGENEQGVYLSQTITVATASSHTFAIFAKTDGLSWVALQTQGFTTPGNVRSYFDLDTGAVGTAGSGHTTAIQDFGNGWFRCSITFTTDSSDTSGEVRIYLADGDESEFVNLDGTASVFIFGSQFNQGPMAQALNTFDVNYVPTTSAAVYQQRLDHDLNGNSTGLLIEEERENLCLQSEALGTTWTVPGTNTTITENITIAPNGITSADEVLHNDSAETIQQTITVTDNTVVAISAFVKQGTIGNHDFVKIAWMDESDGTNGFEAWFDLSGTPSVGTAQATGTGSYTASSAKIENYGNGWQRISAVGQIVTGQTDGRFEIINTTADADDTAEIVDSVFWWGLQVEEGASSSSYIPTTTVAVTRSVESCTVAVANFAWGTNIGAIAAKGGGDASVLDGASGSAIVGTDVASRILLARRLTDTDRARVSVGILVNSNTTTNQFDTTPLIMAGSWDATDVKISLDATAVVSDSGATDLGSVTEIQIGHSQNSGREWDSHINYVAYYAPVAILSDADVLGLTSSEENSNLTVWVNNILQVADTDFTFIGGGFTQPTIAITTGGSGYAVNDILTVLGGSGTAVQMKVTQVLAGAVTIIDVTNEGLYTSLPTNPVSTTGGGSGATFTLTDYSIITDSIEFITASIPETGDRISMRITGKEDYTIDHATDIISITTTNLTVDVTDKIVLVDAVASLILTAPSVTLVGFEEIETATLILNAPNVEISGTVDVDLATLILTALDVVIVLQPDLIAFYSFRTDDQPLDIQTKVFCGRNGADVDPDNTEFNLDTIVNSNETLILTVAGATDSGGITDRGFGLREGAGVSVVDLLTNYLPTDRIVITSIRDGGDDVRACFIGYEDTPTEFREDLDFNISTTIARTSQPGDSSILLADARRFSRSGGVAWVNGERIEYLQRTGGVQTNNGTLTGLVRGSKGTRRNKVHQFGNIVRSSPQSNEEVVSAMLQGLPILSQTPETFWNAIFRFDLGLAAINYDGILRAINIDAYLASRGITVPLDMGQVTWIDGDVGTAFFAWSNGAGFDGTTNTDEYITEMGDDTAPNGFNSLVANLAGEVTMDFGAALTLGATANARTGTDSTVIMAWDAQGSRGKMANSVQASGLQISGTAPSPTTATPFLQIGERQQPGSVNPFTDGTVNIFAFSKFGTSGSDIDVAI